MIGFWEIAFLVIVVVLLLLIPSKLPEFMRNLGRAIKEFKQAMREANKVVEEVGETAREALRENKK